MAEKPTDAVPGEPVAIVGIACRFPGAAEPAQFLEMVLTGRRAFRRIPPVRLDTAEYGEAGPGDEGLRPLGPWMTGSARAALIEGWRFDRAAFGVTEAAYRAADPAHLLALEVAAQALADGGFPGGQGLTRDRTGVIVGNTLTGEVSRATTMRSRWPYVRRVLREALAAGEVSPERHAGVRPCSPTRPVRHHQVPQPARRVRCARPALLPGRPPGPAGDHGHAPRAADPGA